MDPLYHVKDPNLHFGVPNFCKADHVIAVQNIHAMTLKKVRGFDYFREFIEHFNFMVLERLSLSHAKRPMWKNCRGGG